MGKQEALKNTLRQTALLRSKVKGTSYSQEMMNIKAELEEKLLRYSQEFTHKTEMTKQCCGFDPELVTMGMELTTYYIDRGSTSFADYTKVMIEDVGPEIKPYLKSWNNAARHFPGINNSRMTPYDEVKKINLDSIELINYSPKLSEDAERQPVRTEQSGTGTNSEIQDNRISVQPARGPDRSGSSGSDYEIPAILPSSDDGLPGRSIDDVVPRDIAALFR